MKSSILVFWAALLCLKNTNAQNKNILFFVAHEQCYYSEYIVMKEALETAGYTLDIRSSSGDSASTYMIPSGTTIHATANSLNGSDYAEFQAHFLDQFGGNWNSSLNNTPAFIPTNGRIQDIQNTTNYDAIAIAGGTGIQAYRLDGSYTSQGNGNRQVSAADVQAAAEKLNDLIVEAISSGKPVLGQCHGASIPAYCRIPGTSGSGAETLGYSLLKNNRATGYPQAQTGSSLSSLNITHMTEDRLTISSPHPTLQNAQEGNFKILTSRDWYPQTVAYAARGLLNILESYPSASEQSTQVSVLVLHGGALDSLNCHYTNRSNDIPCNYGNGSNLPADYTYLETLLQGNSNSDSFNFSINHQDITAQSLPYNSNNQASIETYLQNYDVVLFFKHWCTGVTDKLQNALANYTDNGGGILTLHHGLYNDVDAGLDKDILAQQLFGTESTESGWSANLTNYQLFNTNYGHFVSTYGIDWISTATAAPSNWNNNTSLIGSNLSYSRYPSINIYDELYNNQTFTSGQSFGRSVNDITPLFSNNQNPAAQAHTSGFVKLYNPSFDNTEGRVAFFQAGERRESININHPFGQVIRNALVWCANKSTTNTNYSSIEPLNSLEIYPNPCLNELTIQGNVEAPNKLMITDLLGRTQTIKFITTDNNIRLNTESLAAGIYILHNKQQQFKFIKQ